ncbi:MAG: hypothetical protein NTV22_04055 [bacterium]|nr:hypothetical protein [bacterium]
MSTSSHSSSTFIVLGIALLACASVGYLAIRAQRTATRLENRLVPQLDTLAAQLARTQQQLAQLDEALAQATQAASRTMLAAVAPDGEQGMADSLVALEGSVSRLEQIMDTTGIEGAATNAIVDPTALSAMLDEYTQRKEVQTLQQTMQKRNAEQHQTDKQKYGEEVAALYEKARFRWGRGRGRNNNNGDRDAAIKELTEKYPDSYATGMVLAETAVGAMFHGDYANVEKYYDQISNNRNYEGVVTDWGFEAVPVLQYNLARHYIEQNRPNDAVKLLDSLEKNYAQSLLPQMGRGPDHTPQTAARAAQQLRQRLQH